MDIVFGLDSCRSLSAVVWDAEEKGNGHTRSVHFDWLMAFLVSCNAYYVVPGFFAKQNKIYKSGYTLICTFGRSEAHKKSNDHDF